MGTEQKQPSMEYILEGRSITKQYSNGVLANDRVDFQLLPGEVHALLGENGAGKSTLVKAFYGLVRPDVGCIYVKNKLLALHSSATAIENGIGMVHQELMLIPYMSVAENVMLGREVTYKGGRLNIRQAEEQICALADSYGFALDPRSQVGRLPIGVQQRVEIVKLLYRKADILILDEPTALLTPQESDALFEVIRMLIQKRKSVIFITHKLKEVYQIADRMTIMRNGRKVTTTTPKVTDEEELTRLMVGKTVVYNQRPCRTQSDRVVLRLEGVDVEGQGAVKALENISFDLFEGEILGVAGIEGNGQTQLAQSIIGLCKASVGKIIYAWEDGEGESAHRDVRTVRDMGVGSIPDDRQGLGLILPFSLYENIAMNDFRQKPYAKNWLYEDWESLKRRAGEVMKEFDVRAQNFAIPVETLSGGNQQKVVVGRELSRPLKLLIAAQPTRGVDVASADFIQQKMVEASEKGTAVLLISSDLDELLKISDRIMVLARGRNAGIVDGKTVSREQLGRMMLGVQSVC